MEKNILIQPVRDEMEIIHAGEVEDHVGDSLAQSSLLPVGLDQHVRDLLHDRDLLGPVNQFHIVSLFRGLIRTNLAVSEVLNNFEQ